MPYNAGIYGSSLTRGQYDVSENNRSQEGYDGNMPVKGRTTRQETLRDGDYESNYQREIKGQEGDSLDRSAQWSSIPQEGYGKIFGNINAITPCR